MTPDIVVCGAGVGGLLCAYALGARGFRVLLLEKRRQPATVAKGEVLQPGSLSILRDLGLLPRLIDRGAVRLERLVVRDAKGEALMVFDYSNLPWPEKSLFALDYHEILATLTEALPDTVSYQCDAMVDKLLRNPAGRIVGAEYSHAGGRESAHAPLVIAADGFSSRLRRLAGLPANPVEYNHRLVSFELTSMPGQISEVSVYVTDRGLRLVYPLPGDRVRLYLQVEPALLRQTSRAGFTEWCSGIAEGAPALAPLREPLLAGIATRQVLTMWRFTAPQLTVPGLALVGESAHSVHPMAAQGMNTAIADASVLADQFTGVELHPATVDDALAGYEAQRRTWIQHIDLMSHDATRMITSTSRVGRLLGRHVLRRTNDNPRLRCIATYNLAGCGIRPFTVMDRLHQLGLPDPRSSRMVI